MKPASKPSSWSFLFESEAHAKSVLYQDPNAHIETIKLPNGGSQVIATTTHKGAATDGKMLADKQVTGKVR